jgi:PAS domain S-box-containing protein
MKKSREELLLHITRLEAILDSLPFDVWMKDKDGTYLIVNQKVSEETGIPKEEINGKTDYDLYDRQAADFYIETDREAMDGKDRGVYVS